LCGCQNIPNCFYGVITCPYQCPCDDQCEFQTHVSTGSCSTPGGRCRQVELTHSDCLTANNGVQTCSYDRILGVCGEGDRRPPRRRTLPRRLSLLRRRSPRRQRASARSRNPAACASRRRRVPSASVAVGSVRGRAGRACPSATAATLLTSPDCPSGYDYSITYGGICCPSPSSCPAPDCNPATGDEFAVDYCMYPDGCPSGYQAAGSCCQRITASPILVDVDGSGFSLTGGGAGVIFDSTAGARRSGWPGRPLPRRTRGLFWIATVTARLITAGSCSAT
jgi:hypothetical protein